MLIAVIDIFRFECELGKALDRENKLVLDVMRDRCLYIVIQRTDLGLVAQRKEIAYRLGLTFLFLASRLGKSVHARSKRGQNDEEGDVTDHRLED